MPNNDQMPNNSFGNISVDHYLSEIGKSSWTCTIKILFLLLLLTKQQTMQNDHFWMNYHINTTVFTSAYIIIAQSTYTHDKNVRRIIWAISKLQHNDTPAPL